MSTGVARALQGVRSTPMSRPSATGPGWLFRANCAYCSRSMAFTLPRWVRLLDDPGKIEGGGDRMGVALPRRRQRSYRDLPQSQVSDLDQGPSNRSRLVNLSPCSEREQSLPRTEMRDDAPDGRPCRPRKHLRNQREHTLSNGASGPRSRHHHSLFACADEEVLYRECFVIVLIASLGPFQPRNLIFLSSRALVASKNFSSSSTARAGRCRMSCKSPSKGAQRPDHCVPFSRYWFAGRKARLSVCIEAQGLDTSRHRV